MKKTILMHLTIMLTCIGAHAQRQSWTCYSPVQSNAIGKQFIGTRPMDSKIVDPEKKITFKSNSSATTLNNDQRRSYTFGMNDIFNSSGLRVTSIEANDVTIDVIDKASLFEVDPGVPFVYAGLRAASSKVTFRRSKSQTYKTDALIDMVTKVYPAIEETELGKFIAFLKATYSTKDSADITITIKNPDVYFLIQITQIDIIWKSGAVDWKKVCASFLSLNNKYTDTLRLENKKGSFNYKTGVASTKFSIFNNGQSADVWFEITKDDSLVIFYTSSYTQTPKRIILEERNETWQLNQKFIFRYPYDANANSLRYKDVLVTFQATKGKDGFKIPSGATKDICGEAFIRYPESKLTFIPLRQR